VYEDLDSGSDGPVSRSEDPNPIWRNRILLLSMRILDSCSIDPEFLVLRIWMPVMRPRFPFPMLLILRNWFPVLDLDSAYEDLDSDS
jgi:hypothetical protein